MGDNDHIWKNFTERQIVDAINESVLVGAALRGLCALWWGLGFDDCVKMLETWPHLLLIREVTDGTDETPEEVPRSP